MGDARRNEMRPVVSIVVPVYKTEAYLPRCVESLLAQTLREIEIILVDDGSPDGCPAICDAYQQAESRVRVIHQANAGVSAARNAGLDAAQGAYVAFLDSDDFIEPEMYALMIQTAREYDCDVVMCDCLKEFPDHSEPYTHAIRPGFYNKEQLQREYYPHLLMMEDVEYPATISNWLCLFKKKNAFSRLRYVAGLRYSEDLLFGAQLLRQADSFYYMKGQYLYHYCMNAQSATHKYVPDKWKDYLLLHQNICEQFAADPVFDFGKQIDLCLLFFVYNAVGDIYGVKALSTREKARRIKKILSEGAVRDMFSRLRVRDLPVSGKQKVITWCYKYQMGLYMLIGYYQ